MSAETKIQWCDSTVNFWEGCAEISPGCAHCYAAARDRRFHGGKHWGVKAHRREVTGALMQALRLNKRPWVCNQCGEGSDGGTVFCKACGYKPQQVAEALTAFHRRRIFSLSLGDWLDPKVPAWLLANMLDTVRRCDQVDWLLLTKRPELFFERLAAAGDAALHLLGETTKLINAWTDSGESPRNVWVGTSVEDQQRADKRLPRLIEIPARVRFLSCEPLLGPIELPRRTMSAVKWVIVGGESGPNAWPCKLEWVRDIVSQGRGLGVACFVKQLGAGAYRGGEDPSERKMSLTDPKGGDPSEWPEDLRVREFPNVEVGR